MTYASGGLIQGSDYNGFATSVNQLWGTGSGNYGYGQSGTLNTSITGTVAASDWATMIARMSTMQQHQFNNTSGIPSQPSSGGIITYLSQISTAITSLQNNRLANYTIGSTPTNSASNGNNWNQYKQFGFTWTFASGDAARYFFNQGGYIQIVCNGSTTNESQWNSFATGNFYYVNLSANSFFHGGTVGSTTRSTYLNTSGYYNLTTTGVNYLVLYDTGTGNSAYNSNYIAINLASNGTQGSNGDAGSVITGYITFWNADSNGFQLPLTGSISCYSSLIYPEATYLSQSFGTPSMATTRNTQS
jgi:hypothetical protein